MTGDRIVPLVAVPRDGTFLFRVELVEAQAVREAILVRVADGVAGWPNYCRHRTDVRLDTGAGAPMRDGEIVCDNHGATFEADSGRCTHGPCVGAYLNGIDVRLEDGDVVIGDPEYEFVGPGPILRGPGDRTSTTNVEF